MTTRLTGRLTVDLPAAEAFVLFTPNGERAWASGWEPHYPVATDDDSAPGTVFQTHVHDRTTTWVVLDREPRRSIRYARVMPETSAGTVSVVLDDAGDSTDVTVTYELTPLSDHGAQWLDDFAAGYPAFLRSWQTAIAAL